MKSVSSEDKQRAADWLPDWLFGFQHDLVDWATRMGRAALFADCGLGKTPMQLVVHLPLHDRRPSAGRKTERIGASAFPGSRRRTGAR